MPAAPTTTVPRKLRIFVSYDYRRDEDLFELFSEHASLPASGFEISGRSRHHEDAWDHAMREEMQAADQLVMICGEHTSGSERLNIELLMAQQEELPYFLLWGRRQSMCTRPEAAKPTDAMYSWTVEILQSQILTVHRTAQSNERLAERSRMQMAKRLGGRKPPAAAGEEPS